MQELSGENLIMRGARAEDRPPKATFPVPVDPKTTLVDQDARDAAAASDAAMEMRRTKAAKTVPGDDDYE